MGHDAQCELGKGSRRAGECKCAERAYERDPMLDEDGFPIPLGRAHGTAAPLRLGDGR